MNDEKKKKSMWATICERAGMEADEIPEEDPPTHIPMTILFAWHPTRDNPNDANPNCQLPHATKPTVFQVGQPCPLKTSFVILAIFEDDFTVRVYGLPINHSQKEEENIPLRWTLTRTTTTMSVAHFPDPNTFFDAVAAEIQASEAELEEVVDPDEPPPPPLPVPGGPGAGSAEA